MKFKLHGGGKMHDGRKVYRIKALKDFGDVKAGDIGGYIESEANLSQKENDNSWVYDNSIVYGRGEVVNDAAVYKDAIVKDSRIEKGARVSHNAQINNSRITNNAIVQDATTFYAKIDNSTIAHETTIKNSSITNSEVGNGVKVYNSKVRESNLANDVLVSAGANLDGAHYTDGERITKTGVEEKLALDLGDLEGLDEDLGLEQ